MKKIVISLLIISFMTLSLSFGKQLYIYAQPNSNGPKKIEEVYLEELKSISEQLYILSSNALKAVIDNTDKTKLIKEADYIKTQIKSMRSELINYHKEQSLDIYTNPISLAFLNALNYYSMSLSHLRGFLNTESDFERSEFLKNYYFSKEMGDQTFSWIKENINNIK